MVERIRIDLKISKELDNKILGEKNKLGLSTKGEAVRYILLQYFALLEWQERLSQFHLKAEKK